MSKSIVEYILNLKSNQFESGLAAADNAAQGLENRMNSLGSAIGMTFGLAGAGIFAKSMIDAGTTVENALTGLTTLLKNSSEAKTVITNTMEDATKTPFAFEGLLAANKALIAADETAAGARQAVLDLSNAIASTGGGDDELQRMVVNLQQIKNTGVATALDIKQFAYAGVNLYKVLDEAGIKHGENAKITYEQITQALAKAHAEGGIYYNGLENMAGNTSVQISNLGDAMFQLKVKMFDDLKPAITATIETLSGFIEKMGKAWEWAVKHQTELKALAAGFLVAKTAAMVIIPLIEGYTIATAAATTATVTMTAAQTALLGPIGLVITAVGLLTAAYVEVSNAAEDAAKAQAGLQNDYKSSTAASLDEQLNLFKSYGLKEGEAIDKVISGRRKLAEEDALLAAQNYERLKGVAAAKGEGYSDEVSQAASEVLRTEANLQAVNEWAKGKKEPKATTSKGLTPQGVKGSTPPAKSTAKTQAVGSKSVTINMNVNKLGEITINTTSISEAGSKVKEYLQGIIIGALNDSQLILEH